MNTKLVPLLLLLLAFALSGCGAARARADDGAPPAVDYTLQSALVDGRMAFVGVGGAIDGQVNPGLRVPPGSRARITLLNGDGMAHDLSVPALNAATPIVTGKGATAQMLLALPPGGAARLDYYCTVPGHRQAGMAGAIVVAPGAP